MIDILFVVPSFSGGGAERVVSVLSSELAEMGNKVNVIVYYKAESEYKYSEKINIINLSGGDLSCYQSMSMFQKVKKLRRVIEKLAPEYIVPFLPQVGFHVFLATLGKKCKIIQTVRNNPKTDPESKIERIIRNVMMSFAWRNFVQNQEQLEYFSDFIKKKTVVMPNPVSNELFEFQHSYNREVHKVVAMGRLASQKNFSMFIEAAAIVHRRKPNIRFYIYGEGMLKAELAKKIMFLGLEDCVIMAGRTKEPYNVMNSADIFVLSSNYEGMPNALMEAMALGVPSISTNCPTGPADIITDGINGRLISINDYQLLAQRIIEWDGNASDMKRVGLEASKTISNKFSASVIARRFIKEVLLKE